MIPPSKNGKPEKIELTNHSVSSLPSYGSTSNAFSRLSFQPTPFGEDSEDWWGKFKDSAPKLKYGIAGLLLLVAVFFVAHSVSGDTGLDVIDKVALDKTAERKLEVKVDDAKKGASKKEEKAKAETKAESKKVEAKEKDSSAKADKKVEPTKKPTSPPPTYANFDQMAKKMGDWTPKSAKGGKGAQQQQVDWHKYVGMGQGDMNGKDDKGKGGNSQDSHSNGQDWQKYIPGGGAGSKGSSGSGGFDWHQYLNFGNAAGVALQSDANANSNLETKWAPASLTHRTDIKCTNMDCCFEVLCGQYALPGFRVASGDYSQLPSVVILNCLAALDKMPISKPKEIEAKARASAACFPENPTKSTAQLHACLACNKCIPASDKTLKKCGDTYSSVDVMHYG